MSSAALFNSASSRSISVTDALPFSLSASVTDSATDAVSSFVSNIPAKAGAGIRENSMTADSADASHRFHAFIS